MAEILSLWEQIDERKEEIDRVDKERQQLYKAQKQIQGNMGALSKTGKEGALRARYVGQLEETENRLRALGRRERDLNKEIERLEQEIKRRLRAFE